MKNKFTWILAIIAGSMIGTASGQIPYRAPITSALVNSTFGAKDYANTWSSTNIFQGQFSLDEVVNSAAVGSNAEISTTKPSIILTGALTSVGSIGSPATGKLHVITNRTGGAVTFVNEYGSATAANRIITGTGADISVASNGSIILSYNNNNSRWQIVGGTGGISSLTGDVTATGPGAAAATVASVGGSTAAAVGTATVLANAATDASTVSTIVKRDASGISSFDKLKLDGSTSGTVTLQTGTTPTSHSVTVPDTVCTAGQVWSDNGSGVMSCTTPSAGGVNLIGNGTAEVNNSGWTCYADAAGTSPVDATAGSPTVTFTQSASSPLIGTGSFIYTKDAANRQGEGCAYSFTVDSGYRAKVLQIEFEYLVGSGTFSAGSTSADSDVTVWLYDVINSVLIQPTTYKLFASNTSIATRHVSNFQTSATGATYRLILHSGSTSASAYTLKIDDVQVKPSQYVYGTPISDWTDTGVTFTSLITASSANPTFGTSSLNRVLQRRVGDSMEYRYELNYTSAGTAGTGDWFIALPNGRQFDPAKVQYWTTIEGTGAHQFRGSNIGFATMEYQATSNGLGHVVPYDATRFRVCGLQNGGSGWCLSDAAFSAIGTAGSIYVTLTAPIAGFSSSVQMSDQADSRVVSATVNSSTTSIGSGSDDTVIFTTIEGDTHAAYSAATGLYTVPVAGDYEVGGKISFGAAFSLAAGNTLRTGIKLNGSVVKFVYDHVQEATLNTTHSSAWGSVILKNLKAGDTIGFSAFQNSGSARAIAADTQRTYMSISRLSQASLISATETVALQVTGAAAAANVGNPIIFPTVVRDTHNAYNATTGRYTCPTTGLYLMSSGFRAGSGTNSPLQIFKDAVVVYSIGFKNSTDGTAAASGAVTCNAGQILDLRPLTAQVSGMASDSSYTIYRIGM